MEKFAIHPYTKKALALMYFPDSSPHTAVNHLMEWIRRSPELTSQLKDSGYHKTSKQFTPRQVQLITDYLGTPGRYD